MLLSKKIMTWEWKMMISFFMTVIMRLGETAIFAREEGQIKVLVE
jgi:hypothetical protein